MAWSYSGDPSASALDQVRFLVGDVDTANQQISNEEILYVLTVHGAAPGTPNYAAAAVVADAIAARYSSKANKTVGGLSIQYSERRDAFTRLAVSLRGSARMAQVGPPQLGGGGVTYLGNDYT